MSKEVKSTCCNAPVIYSCDKNDPYGTCSACENQQNSHILTYKAKEKLKPCPFCGGKAKTKYVKGDTGIFIVCKGKMCCVEIFYDWMSGEQAISAWNNRRVG